MHGQNSITGVVRIRAESADPSQLLSSLSQLGLRLYDITYIDELTVEFTIPAKSYSQAVTTAENRGEIIKLCGRSGIVFAIRKLVRRPVLILGIFLFLVLSLFLPTRILFVEVEGNQRVADRLILEHAENAGIRFGALRRSIRSEQLKNTLLGELPQLQWAGVNTRGCIAVITVTERDAEQEEPESEQISHIVAARDGVIRSITVSQGTPLCQVGQAVTKGQVLVSGYTDCGIAIKAQRATAEILAQTSRKLEAIALASPYQRGEVAHQTQRYRIILGKKQINLWKDSGISDTTCVKIYEESFLTLPGGFTLPIGIGKEQLIYYDDPILQTAATSDFVWLEDWTERYLSEHMVCGQILNKQISISEEDGICRLSANYGCLEMIGNNRYEELIKDYGKND